MEKEIQNAYSQMTNMSSQEQSKFKQMLAHKLKSDFPDEYAEYESRMKLGRPSNVMERTSSIGGASNSSAMSAMTKFTNSTAIYSIAESATPTKFVKAKLGAATTVEPEVEEPCVFLNIDDEEEVKRSKQRALARLAQQK